MLSNYVLEDTAVISSIIFFVLIIVILCVVSIPYVLNGIAFMKLAKQRGIDNPWMAWVPFANTYLIGKISDDINACYQNKTNRRITLLVLDIVLAVSVIPFCVIIGDFVVSIIKDAMNDSYKLSFSYINGFQFSLLVIIILLMFVLAMLVMIIQFMSYYSIFKEYSPSNAGLFLALSIIAYFVLSCGFIAPIIILCIYKNTPQYTMLKARVDGFNANASRYQAGYNRQPYRQPYQQPNQQSYQQPNSNQPEGADNGNSSNRE